MACLLFIVACTPIEQPVRLGTFGGWPGYEPLYLAQDLGYLNEKRVRLVDYSSSTPLQNDFAHGVIEAATLTLDESVRLISRRPDLTIVLLLDESRGADALLTRAGILSIQMLRGKKVGVEPSGVGAYLLGRALEKSGMMPGDILPVPVRFDEHERAFLEGEIDAVATFEPVKSRLTQRGAVNLFDSSQIPGEIVDVLVVRRDILRERRPLVREILSAWFRALDYMKAHHDESHAHIADRLGINEEQEQAVWRGIVMGDRAANLAAIKSGSLEDALRLNIRTLRTSGMLDSSPRAQDILDASLISELHEERSR